MPGPERLSTECILLGCIPIISSRWVGASRVDFPGVRRVDHQNVTDIEVALAAVAANFEEELQSEGNRKFYKYAMSMWQRVHHSADVVFGSSYVHFVLAPRTLQEEHVVAFQLLSLLYLYPLCSVDVFVVDVLWFIRHHYAFVKLLQSAGYMRIDPLNPTEHAEWLRDTQQTTAFVRLKQLGPLDAWARRTRPKRAEKADGDDVDVRADGSPQSSANEEDSAGHSQEAGNTGEGAEITTTNMPPPELQLQPKWAAVTVVLPVGLTFSAPHMLLQHISDLPIDGYTMLLFPESVITPGYESSAPVEANPNIISILGPKAKLGSYRMAVRAANGDISRSEARDPFPKMVSMQEGDVLSVCPLLDEQATPSSAWTENIIAGVVRSAAWQEMRVLADAFGFQCSHR